MKIAIKPILLAAVLQLAGANAGICQTAAPPPSENQLAAAKELMTTLGLEAILRAAVDNQTGAIEQQLKKALPDSDPTMFKLLEDISKDEFSKNMPAMLDTTAKIYARHFSEADLRTMIAFYHTETGQRVVAEMPAVAKESAEATAGIAGDILVRFRAEMKKRNSSDTPPK